MIEGSEILDIIDQVLPSSRIEEIREQLNEDPSEALRTVEKIRAKIGKIKINNLEDIEDRFCLRVREILDVDMLFGEEEIRLIVSKLEDLFEVKQAEKLQEWTLTEDQKSVPRLELLFARTNETEARESSEDMPGFLGNIISKHPLLTVEEEIILSYHIKTRDKDDKLYKRSIERMVYSNIKLLFSLY